MEQDIRWIQRYNNFQKAFFQLKEAVELKKYNKLEKQGIIKAFEFTFELAWKTLQDFLKYNGYIDAGPKPVIQQALKDNYINNGEGWMNMLNSKNLSAHTYDEATADIILEKIKIEYFALLQLLLTVLQKEINQ